MSIRQQIIDAIETRLEGILTGISVTVGGASYDYQTDLGESVHLRRETAFEKKDLPAANIHPGTGTVDSDRSEFGRLLWELPITIAIVARQDDTETASAALQDLLKAIGSDPTFGGLARDTLADVGREAAVQQGQSLIEIPVELTITYRADRWEI